MSKILWQQKYPEKYHAYRKKWYRKNKENVKAYVKKWRKENPELYQAQIKRTHEKNYARQHAEIRARRIANIKPRACVGCGKMFKPDNDNKTTCGVKCDVARKKYNMHKFYIEHKEKLRAYKAMKQREYYYKAKELARR